MEKTSDSLLLIFTRNPELGKCKTRLAATIGNEAALEVYKFLLAHTATITSELDVNKQVYYSEKIWQEDVWPNTVFSKKLQQGADLGARMHHAFQEGFEAGYKKIIVIGSDMYDLSKEDLETAFSTLEQHDFVVGPAKDGGYYLLGMKKLRSTLFENKAWGTASVLSDTLTSIENENFTLLSVKNDIDLYEDIREIDAFEPFIEHIKNDTGTT
ncbi:MAG: glycosyltransferase [Allomuricauda sp.]|nr:MAG: glycosyltransferase [Allomuricauda sp.]